MSWHKITLPLTMEIDPDVVQIGKISWDCFERENRPDGFGMFHASRGSEVEIEEKRLVYLSPVASELCRKEIEAANFTLEPCDVPAADEPNMIWVFGDPRVMGMLKEHFEPPEGTWEWKKEQMLAEQQAAALAEYEAAQAEAAAAASQSDTAQA